MRAAGVRPRRPEAGDRRKEGWPRPLMKNILKEPVNALTHFAGAALAVIGLVYLVVIGLDRGPWHWLHS